MRVYHFSSAKHAIENLRHKRLKIATLPDINDPFELAVCCSDHDRREALRGTRREWASVFGMLCFSGNWQNPVQWSHYADKHRGICLGFDVPADLLVKVQYKRMPPQLNWGAIEEGGRAGEAEMMRWSSTKFEHWAYEDEWRAFLSLEETDTNGLYFKDFDESLKLREVFVGPECSASRADIAEALGNARDVGVSKTRAAFRGYRIVRQRNASIWH
jgi:hypothetical protein